ncbi:MAG: Crp/Fnr family transcriptional regulator [Schleiferiaceae bacterium]
MNELINWITSSLTITKDAEDYIKSVSQVNHYKKGDALLKSGDTVRKAFFIKTGCVRSYFVGLDGKEHTVQFATANWWISDYRSHVQDVPATLYIECLSEVDTIELEWSDLENIYKRFPYIETFKRHNCERHLAIVLTRIIDQLRLSAVDRYQNFVKTYPDVMTYAKDYHIASYLGIAPQSLSRLKHIQSKKK